MGRENGVYYMRSLRILPWTVGVMAALALCSLLLIPPARAQAAPSLLKQISQDPFTNKTSQHLTQVEPDTYAFGGVTVSAFQSGRFFSGGGSSGISWATSFDGGQSWTTGILPGMTVFAGGPYLRVSDSVVTYDLAHHTWLIVSLAFRTNNFEDTNSTVVVVSRSPDGIHWSSPVTVSASSSTTDWDKEWITCDQHPDSRFFGRCYAQWDDNANNGQIMSSFSTDGGLTWSALVSPATQSFAALGVQPVVQPNGTVIAGTFGTDLATGNTGIYAYRSTDGGASWTVPFLVAPALFIDVPGTAAFQYRGGSLPSLGVDARGKVYLVWSDCVFEQGCTASVPSTGTDDMVLTTTTDGLTWSPLARIPLDPVGSGVEHLTAGLAVDPSAAGDDAHLALTYYYLPNPFCTTQPCQVFAGFASSVNGGKSWSAAVTLAGPTAESSYANTDAGFMTGDYIATAIALNQAVTVIPVAQAPHGGHLNEAMYAGSLEVVGGDQPVQILAAPAIGQAAKRTGTTKVYRTAN